MSEHPGENKEIPTDFEGLLVYTLNRVGAVGTGTKEPIVIEHATCICCGNVNRRMVKLRLGRAIAVTDFCLSCFVAEFKRGDVAEAIDRWYKVWYDNLQKIADQARESLSSG